jgi:hypothetical protein
MPPQLIRSYTVVALLIFGIVCTFFGGIVFAVPFWFFNGILAHSDCNNHCVPPVPSEHTIDMQALGIVIGFAIIGFLPLILYLIFSHRKKGDPDRLGDDQNFGI